MSEHNITVLGIHDGHNAGATLLTDGQVVASVSEERISRLKNDPGYPKRAIEKVLEIAGCAPDSINIIALGTKFIQPRDFYLNWDWYKRGYREQVKANRTDSERSRYFLAERLQERKRTGA